MQSPALRQLTAAELSQKKRTDFPDQYWPQMVAEITMGINSNIAILVPSGKGGHFSATQAEPYTMPKPMLPAASEEIVKSGMGLSFWWINNETPFHTVSK